MLDNLVKALICNRYMPSPFSRVRVKPLRAEGSRPCEQRGRAMRASKSGVCAKYTGPRYCSEAGALGWTGGDHPARPCALPPRPTSLKDTSQLFLRPAPHACQQQIRVRRFKAPTRPTRTSRAITSGSRSSTSSAATTSRPRWSKPSSPRTSTGRGSARLNLNNELK